MEQHWVAYSAVSKVEKKAVSSVALWVVWMAVQMVGRWAAKMVEQMVE